MRHERQVRPGEPAEQVPAETEAGAEAPGPVSPVPLPSRPVVGSADDPAEAAADRMADAALARLRAGAIGTGADEAPGAAAVRRSAAATSPPGAEARIGAGGGELDQDTAATLAARRGRGAPLPPAVQRRMEGAFGRSFAGVRVHDDAPAHRLSATISAHAFTAGTDIFFGRGAYEPDSPLGERVLAHELAHTVAGGPAIGRWSPFGSGKTDEQKAQERQRKDEEQARKRQEKEDKKQRKRQEKEQAKQTKANARRNKKLESGEAKHQAQERKRGKAGRKELADKIAGEAQTDPETGQVVEKTSAYAVAVHKRFESALRLEKALVRQLVKEGLSDAEAIEQAYQEVWLDTTDTELRDARPPRETAAERLRYEVEHARLEDRLDDAELERGKLGTMLPEELEEFYEQWETEAERLRVGPPETDPQVADLLAYKTVWAQASKKVKKQRDKIDPKIERQARIDARKRLKLGRRDAPPPKSKLDTALAGSQTVAGYTANVLDKTAGPTQEGLDIAATPGGSDAHALKGMEQVAGIGTVMKAAEAYKSVVKQASGDDSKPERSSAQELEALASEGIGDTVNVLNDLVSSVTDVLKMAQSISTAATETTVRNVVGAAKSCNDAGKGALSKAKHAAELAKLIDPGVSSGVAQVIPGLNIAMAVMSIVGNAIDLGLVADRMSDINNQLTAARGRDAAAKAVDVLVFPLLHVHDVLAKQLEQACWKTASSIVSLATSIATVASGGGYGVPAAVEATNKLLGLLHNAGHFVADQIIAYRAKQSRADSIGKLEGSAEIQMKRDPAMAVDAIVVRAKEHKDPVAIKFLVSYGVKEEEVAGSKLSVVRAKVLKGIGEDADPAYFYESYVQKAKSVGNWFTAQADQWKSTGELAQQRNEMDGPEGSQRGWAWRVKMTMKTQGGYQRSKAKTAAQQDNDVPVVCRVGKFILLDDPTASEIARFTEQVETLPDSEILRATGDEANAEEWRELLVELLQSRIARNTQPVRQ